MVIIMYYLNNFFLFSILGHLFETIIFLVIGSKRKSGFLYLWWTPFYGIGVLLSIYFDNKLNKFIKRRFVKNIILFFIYLIIFTVLEASGGILLHFIYKKDFWNYSKVPFHIGKYVSLPTSLLWVFFRAASFSDSILIIRNIFIDFNWNQLPQFCMARPAWCIMMGALIIFHFVPQKWADGVQVLFVKMNWALKLIVFLISVQLVIEFMSEEVAPFIYFQF